MNAKWFHETVLPKLAKDIPLSKFQNKDVILLWDKAPGHVARRVQEFARVNFFDFVDSKPTLLRARKSCRRTWVLIDC